MSLKDVKTYSFEQIMPKEFAGLLVAEKRVEKVDRPDKDLVKEIIDRLIASE